MAPPPAYTLVPACNLEKALALEDTPTATLARSDLIHRGRLYALGLAATISIITLVALLYFPAAGLLSIAGLGGAACDGTRLAAGAAMTRSGAPGAESEDAGEKVEVPDERNGWAKYSTSVYPNGDTSSFEFKTRPIVRAYSERRGRPGTDLV